MEVIDRVPKLRTKAAHLKERMKNAIIDNFRYAHEHGTDRPEIVRTEVRCAVLRTNRRCAALSLSPPLEQDR
jgi:hypothetical protein